MMHPLLARPKRETPYPNVFINGVGADFPTKQDLLDELFATEADLFNYHNDGENISFYYDVSKDFDGFGLTFFNAKDVLILGDLLGRFENFSFNSSSTTNTTTRNILLTGNPTSTINSLRGLNNLKRCFMPNVTTLGSSTGNNTLFTGTPAFLICDDVLETNNGGSPDGDITNLINIAGGSVLYSTDKTPPSDVTDLSVSNIDANYCELNFTKPATGYVLVFVDNYFRGIFDINDTIVATGLTPDNNHTIKIIVSDDTFNLSGFSNEIGVQTTATNTLFDNTVAYYKLNETTGDALDSINTQDGTVYGGVTRNGSNYDFNGLNSYVDFGDSNLFTFTDGTDLNDVAFSISFRINFNSWQDGWIISKRGDAGTDREWQIFLFGGDLSFYLYNESTPNNIIGCAVENFDTNFNLNTNYFVTVTYDGSKLSTGLGISIDAVDEVTNQQTNDASYVGMTNTTSPLLIGKAWSGLYLDAKVDNVNIVKGHAYTPAEQTALYNSGSIIEL